MFLLKELDTIMFTVNYSKYLSEELIEVEIFIGN